MTEQPRQPSQPNPGQPSQPYPHSPYPQTPYPPAARYDGAGHPTFTYGTPNPGAGAPTGTPNPGDTAQVGPSIQAPAATTTTATTTRPRTKIATRVAALAGICALSLGMGGLGAYAVGGHTTTVAGSSTTVTKVVQGSSSAPDWSVTASAVLPSTVSIAVTSSAGEGEGSGVVWDTQGHIVTNNHVASALGSGATITVTLADNTVWPATVVATDPASDLAVLQITNPPSTLVPIKVASDAVAVGDPVMAIGNPLGLDQTVTTGVVSALDRPVTTSDSSSQQQQQLQSQQGTGRSQGQSQSQTQTQSASSTVVTDAIQVSAAINPGNSGGALVDANGELVGINFSIASLSSSSSESGNIGIGFAIPAAKVKTVVSELLTSGSAKTPVLGVSTSDGTGTLGSAQRLGAKVSSVTTGSAADKAGIKAGDVIIALGGQTVTSSESLAGAVRSESAGQTVEVQVLRSGQQVSLQVALG